MKMTPWKWFALFIAANMVTVVILADPSCQSQDVCARQFTRDITTFWILVFGGGWFLWHKWKEGGNDKN